MNEQIRVIFVVILSVSCMVMSMNISTYARSTKYLKEDLEIAVHDASLAIDQTQLGEGTFKIDRDKALDQFKESFEYNTGLTEGDYIINDFQVFDETNSTFPVEYQPSNLDFKDTFLSPSVVAVVETTTKKYFFGDSKERKIRRVASYSYKVKKIDNAELFESEIMNDLILNENGLYWVVPYTTNITSGFDPYREHPITHEIKPHNGIDIASAGVFNQPAVATKEGTVKYAGSLGGYGNLVTIDHGGGFETRYAHLNSIAVTKGQVVSGAQIIGYIGSTGDSTGAHLHYETRINGKPVDPMFFY